MRVLLGIGGSDDAYRALDRAFERVERSADELTVAVLDNPAVEASPATVVERVESLAAEAGIDVRIQQLKGDPGPALVTLAETEGYEEIVLGGGQESPLGKIDVGRIAEFVVLNSTVTVTLVR